MTRSQDTALAEFRAELGAAPDADARNRMRHTVLNATLHPRPVSRFRSVMVSRRAVAGSVAALAVAGAVGAAVVAPNPSDETGRERPVGQSPPGVVIDADTGAPLILELAAQRAAASTPVPVRAGQFVYTRTESTGTDVTDARGDIVHLRVDGWTEIWYDPEGMLAVRIRGEDFVVPPLTDAQRASAERLGYPHKRDEVIADYQALKAALAKNGPSLNRPTPAYLAALPTDPDQLLAALRTAILAEPQQHGAPRPTVAPDNAVFASIYHLFFTADAIVPPALKAAFYRVLVKLSGVERVPGEVTIGGRTGIAIGLKATSVKHRVEIVLDATTFAFIGTRSNPGQPTGSTVAVTASTVVDAVGDTG